MDDIVYRALQIVSSGGRHEEPRQSRSDVGLERLADFGKVSRRVERSRGRGGAAMMKIGWRAPTAYMTCTTTSGSGASTGTANAVEL